MSLTTPTTPDIEAVKAGPAKCGHHYNAHCQSCRNAYDYNLATITALQARVDELEAPNTTVVEHHHVTYGRAAPELEAQLATLRAAIAEAWAEAHRRCPHGESAFFEDAHAIVSPLRPFITEPLRNLDQPEGEGKAEQFDLTDAQRQAALEGRVTECPYNHPVGTRCPNCAHWPFKKGGAAQFVADVRAQAEPTQPEPESTTKFRIGDRVEKVRGSNWRGTICGTYSTSITPEGYAVESAMEPGNVQIYPVAALKAWDQPEPDADPLVEAAERCIELVERYNHRQNEKVEDVKHILRKALASRGLVRGEGVER